MEVFRRARAEGGRTWGQRIGIGARVSGRVGFDSPGRSFGLMHVPGYLDSASGQPLHPAAREVISAALDRGYADPRRLHGAGRDARLLLDNAREALADCCGVRPDEVTFTASGTDACHRGLLGLARGRHRAGRTIALSAVEHSALAHAVTWSGAPELTLPVDHWGRVDVDQAGDLVRDSTEPVGVVACQLANHEVGTIQPVADLAAAATGVPVFMDACAAAGWVDLPDHGWAAAALSAHKWGGPAGVGALLVRKGSRWRAPFPVDDRGDERATGFENVPAALASAAALQAVLAERAEVAGRLHGWIDRIRAEVPRLIPDCEVVGDPVGRLPGLVTFSCLYVDGEALVTELDRRGHAIASGSACASSTLTPSHVLAAMGALTQGNVRVSLSRETTQADVDRLLADLPVVIAELRERL